MSSTTEKIFFDNNALPLDDSYYHVKDYDNINIINSGNRNNNSRSIIGTNSLRSSIRQSAEGGEDDGMRGTDYNHNFFCSAANE